MSPTPMDSAILSPENDMGLVTPAHEEARFRSEWGEEADRPRVRDDSA